MDETSLRGLLETAVGDEPPIGPAARDSLRAGIKLRRRARIRHAAAAAAVVAVMAAVLPAVTGVFGNTAAGPHPGAARQGTGDASNSGGGTARPGAAARGTAYVINSGGGTVTPIDLATNTPGKPIKIGHDWDSGFEAIVIAPRHVQQILALTASTAGLTAPDAVCGQPPMRCRRL